MTVRESIVRAFLKLNIFARTPEVEVLKLSKEDSLKLWEALENPPEPNEALQKAAKDYNNIFGLGDK